MDYHTLKKINKKAAGGKRLISLLITEDYRKKLSLYLKSSLRASMRRRVFQDRASNLRDLVGSSERHVTPVTQPLMLIFDHPASGGILLNQLFDDHPQLHVHPGEIVPAFDDFRKHAGSKRRLNPAKRPGYWFSLLTQGRIAAHLEEVFQYIDIVDSPQPMVFIPYLQQRIFRRYLKLKKSGDVRTACDAYMTSYFGSWLNYANLYGHDKRFIVAYSKTHVMSQGSLKQFFEAYPDGKMTFIIRNPKNCISPASNRQSNHSMDTQLAINHWLESTEAMIRIKEAFDSRVCIIQHRDLTGNTEAVLRHLCQFLKVEYDRILLYPTFNGSKVKAFDSTQIVEDPNKTPLRQHGDAYPDGLETNWYQTLNKYEAVVSKSVQF